MKKNYIQPTFEVLTLNTAYCICAESTPFNYGGQSIPDADPV